MKNVYWVRTTCTLYCGTIGEKTNLRLANGSKLHVGDIVEVVGKSGSKYHSIVVLDPSSGVFVLWGFAKCDFDEMKSKYKLKKAIPFGEVTGNEKCITHLHLKIVDE